MHKPVATGGDLAAVRARVAVVRVVVVALLAAGAVDRSIAAPGVGAVDIALLCFPSKAQAIPIAFFTGCLVYDAVTAYRQCAVRVALLGRTRGAGPITVALLGSRMHKPVATGGDLARVQASVIVVAIAVVTLFAGTRVDHTVAAFGSSTVDIAFGGLPWNAFPITVALLGTRLLIVHETVTAPSRQTQEVAKAARPCVRTGIHHPAVGNVAIRTRNDHAIVVVVAITVVALFEGIDDVISAHRRSGTGVIAGVKIVVVAIIAALSRIRAIVAADGQQAIDAYSGVAVAFFLRVDRAVAAPLELASVAAAVPGRIALLVGVDGPVAALLFLANATAAIAGQYIAVVTPFVAFLKPVATVTLDTGQLIRCTLGTRRTNQSIRAICALATATSATE